MTEVVLKGGHQNAKPVAKNTINWNACSCTCMEPLRDLLVPTQACICSAQRRLSRAVTQHYEAAFRKSNLRATQFTVLSTVAQTGPLPLSKLASMLGLERTTLTRNAALLVDGGFLALLADDDARVRRVALTTKGEAAVREAFPLWRAAQESVGRILQASRFEES